METYCVSCKKILEAKLHKPLIKKIKRRKVYTRFKDNIWAASLAEMGSLSSKNKNVKFLLCVIDVFTKYACVKPLKNEKGRTVLHAFIEIVNESNRKPNKLWVDQVRESYINFMQEWLDNNNILMFSTHNKDKLVISERFIRILKAKIYKKMTTNDIKSYLSYCNKLVDQYNNTYHHSINKKPFNDDYSALTEKIETNLKAPKFKVNGRVRITKYKNVFSKGYTENWSIEIFITDSVLKTDPWTYKIIDI